MPATLDLGNEVHGAGNNGDIAQGEIAVTPELDFVKLARICVDERAVQVQEYMHRSAQCPKNLKGPTKRPDHSGRRGFVSLSILLKEWKFFDGGMPAYLHANW
ncbi:hypothetical protein [Paracoccus spongiarum]|uniref:Uncharacterized protein n=1 Tax=Paracoccus spongiarum TaxID=3064387 RepID=A0ABT9JGY7_9RHOB|nr:hypothetical protein [Paracoccus sp. 2205BS29-5]MDP5309098.1 hypothetical protein [Paracoccus sp. 2205BS29-5]